MAAVLRLLGREVARYVWAPSLPVASAPRPYLHPVRTLAGHVVTDARPDSHQHQLGISIALPDVGGYNFWGGRTYVAGHGPAWLDNHGIQRHERWLSSSETGCEHALSWVGAHDGVELLRERRSISARLVAGAEAWILDLSTSLTNATGQALALRTPAASGRAGAGYGGYFWRGPAISGNVRLLSPQGTSVGAVHGVAAPWLAVSPGTGEWTMLLVPGDSATAQDRWFVRARDYLGVGLSPCWDRPLVLAPAETLSRRLLAIVADGALPAAAAEKLAAEATP
ncbi:DUF6807 domain-containing protein [Flindersiella endophytica]